MKRTCPICQKKYISRKIVDDIIKDFPDDKSTWITMECPNNENHGRILLEREIEKLPKETKQEVLDLMHQGKSVGDVCKMLKLDTMIVAEIICQNIGTIRYLKREIVPKEKRK